jgi:hypothetical protein
LGPLEAANGALMFGVSTAIFFAVIQRLLETRFGPQGLVPGNGVNVKVGREASKSSSL